MTRILAVAVTALLLTAHAPQPVQAQEALGGAIFGGLLGAGIGSAIGGRNAVGVGAVTGFAIGAEAERRRFHRVGYVFLDARGRCWHEYPDGRVVRVAQRECY